MALQKKLKENEERKAQLERRIIEDQEIRDKEEKWEIEVNKLFRQFHDKIAKKEQERKERKLRKREEEKKKLRKAEEKTNLEKEIRDDIEKQMAMHEETKQNELLVKHVIDCENFDVDLEKKLSLDLLVDNHLDVPNDLTLSTCVIGTFQGLSILEDPHEAPNKELVTIESYPNFTCYTNPLFEFDDLCNKGHNLVTSWKIVIHHLIILLISMV